MKKLIITAAISVLVMSGSAFAGTNVNGFAYQLQKAGEVTVNASSGKDNGNGDAVIGSQIIHSDTSLNINGRALQEMAVGNAEITATGLKGDVAGLQVANSNGVMNVNGSLEQLLFSPDVSVTANDVQDSVVGAQVVRAKGDLNVNGAVKQMMFADNITVAPVGAKKSIVGAQVIAGR